MFVKSGKAPSEVWTRKIPILNPLSRNSDYNAFTYSNFYSVDKINNFKFL